MMIFWLLIVLLWSVRLFANVFSYIHLWWVKEYRYDRMLVHLKTKQGKNILFIPFRFPPLTPKTIALTMCVCFTLVCGFFWLPFQTLLKLLLLDLITFPLTWLWVGVVQLPTYVYHQMLIRKAVAKLRSHKNLKVIGITGSFGKTSTKEYLATILSTKYKVLKTEASKNSPIGIAEVVLRNLCPDHEVFVVEMGAYKKGEIAKMSQMVRPSVGVITAINPQHQDLFGSIEVTMKAKYELIEGLQVDGIGIFNGDDEKVRTMAEWGHRDEKRVWFFTRTKQLLPRWADTCISAENSSVRENNVAFTFRVADDRINLSAPVLGEHQISNILAAASGAIALTGMSLKDVARGVRHLRPYTKTMQPVRGIKESIFINDTFNNNPDAARAAMLYLAKTKGKKIVVFQPMIELGSYAKTAHEMVGRAAAQICDYIFLTNDNFFESFVKGVKSASFDKEVHVMSPEKTAKKIKEIVRKGDTVLFKGKEAEHVLKLLQ